MPSIPDTFPSTLHSAAQVRELDAQLIAAGTPGFELMQRAAHACWRALRRQWPEARAITVLAGGGNNAGDGYLIAALAQRAGWQTQVLTLAEPARLDGEAAEAFSAACEVGVDIQPWHEAAAMAGVLVDALLGTGLNGPVRAPYTTAIEHINASGLPVFAVDIPSGLCADSGHSRGATVRADLTLSLIALKLGLFCGEGPGHTGKLLFDDLQADPALLAATPVLAQRLTGASVPRLAPRRRAAHKGEFGHVLVIGGDQGTGGAGLLAAESALRCGAGLVSLATRPAHIPAALARCPEIMSQGLASANQLLALTARAGVLVVGPGLGQMAWGRSLLSAAASCQALPQVWDADALNLLASGAVSLPPNTVLTPHPGEAARLLGLSTAEVQADRPRAAQLLVERYQACVVLKGAGTLIAAADQPLALCDRGHPAMAGAGLGDVLAGVIGALMAQGLSGFDAARLAVWLHARAGERLGVAGRGLVASDLIAVIRQLLEEHAPCLS